MRRSPITLVIITVAAILVAGAVAPLAVTAIDGDVVAVWKDYVVAEKRLQFDVSRLLTEKWPELAEVANLQRDQTFADLALRNLAFEYLLEQDPSRIVIDGDLSAFTEFEWSEEDSDSLRARNPYFARLEQWAASNARRLAEHPDLALAGERLYSLQRDEYYLKMIERFQSRLYDLESALDRLAKQRRPARVKETR